MTRKLFPILVLILLGLPASASSQTRQPAQSAAGAQQSEIFLNAYREILQRSKGAPTDSALWAGAMDGLIKSLNDPYATIFNPEAVKAFDESNTGNYSGIGVQISQLNDRVTITKVFRETPAEHAGLLEGDVIVGVGPNDATTWTTEMASDSIRGPAGTPVKIMIKRPGISVDVPYTMTRAQVHVASVTAGIVDGTKVGYIRMDQVTRGSAQEIDSALTMLTGGGATGLVIDLRRNPGGFLDEALMTSDIFLKPGEKLASLVSRNANVRTNNGTTSEDFTDQARAKAPTVPIAVLVDEYTASAAEIISGALQDHDRALVIGQRTFGKGIVQSVLDLPYGYKLRITTGSWQTPLGREIHRARDAGGKLVGEDPDTFPKVRTPAGREIVNGGGIFPDLALTADTLKTVERQLEETSAQKQVPLGVRIAEFAFQEAQRIRQAGGTQEITFAPASFQAFLDRLQREGVPAETIANPQVKDYLNFRVRETIAQRLANREGSLAKVLSERDNVLGQAIKLVQQSPTQTDLYANAKKVTQAASARPGSN